MPRKASTPLPKMTQAFLFKESSVVRIPAVKPGKRKVEQMEELKLTSPSKKPAPSAARSISFAGGVKFSPSKDTHGGFGVFFHNSTRDLKHLVYRVGSHCCFAFFPKSYFKYDPKTMPCLQQEPLGDFDVASLNKWWVGIELDPSFEVKCLPAPSKGFIAGDFVSFRGSPGSYGCIMAVIDRGGGHILYAVCAVMEGDHRLLMVTQDEVAGPELSFVTPIDSFWTSGIYNVMRVGDPGKYGFFETPSRGFLTGDPVTVFTPFSEEPVDGIVEFVTFAQDLPVEYGVRITPDCTNVYPVGQVSGAGFDRLVPSLDLKQAKHPWTPEASIPEASDLECDEYDEEYGILKCEETMPFFPTNDGDRDVLEPGSPGASPDHHATEHADDLFFTPCRPMTDAGGRSRTGQVAYPWQGELLARQCRLCQASGRV
jgi:hypothetical protein